MRHLQRQKFFIAEAAQIINRRAQLSSCQRIFPLLKKNTGNLLTPYGKEQVDRNGGGSKSHNGLPKRREQGLGWDISLRKRD